MTKKVLIIVNNPPFGTVFPAEAVRAGIAFAGMDLDTFLVFSDDGVFSLLKKQNPDLIGAGSLKEGFANATEFGLKVAADANSLTERNIQIQEIQQVEILADKEINKLVRGVGVIINF